MIKLYKVNNEKLKAYSGLENLFFADEETDKTYEIGYNDELEEQEETIDEMFDIENAEVVEMSDYYKVLCTVDEKNTFNIKDMIKADGGKWNGMSWKVPGPSDNYKTILRLLKK